jgi:uncharacterized membrane protein
MAGIGFELRKLLRRESYTGLLGAYAYAGAVGAGPWVLSIISILLIGILSLSVVIPGYQIAQFQVTVTYLYVLSLILTGLVQLGFTRWVADRLFEKREALITPNFNGVLLVVTGIGGLLGLAAVFALFPEQSDLYRVLFVAGFVIMCCIWTGTIFLTGLKRYRDILLLYLIGYAITVGAALAMRPLGIEGLLLGFVVGHFVLLMGIITLVARGYPSERYVAFDFARRGAMYGGLIYAGFMFHLAVWTDKFLFWYHPDTGQTIIGPLHASIIYDMPVFLAYLAIIPGMAVFLVRIETDFAEYFTKFYDAVREGASLEFIEGMRDEMVYTVRQALFEIVKIQGMAILVVFVGGPWILEHLGISLIYVPLLYINVVSAGLQVVLLGIVSIFYYLDKRVTVVLVTTLFFVANLGFTSATLWLGAPFYGYGYALALLVTVVVAMRFMETKLALLEYETFMLQ